MMNIIEKIKSFGGFQLIEFHFNKSDGYGFSLLIIKFVIKGRYGCYVKNIIPMLDFCFISGKCENVIKLGVFGFYKNIVFKKYSEMCEEHHDLGV